MTTVILILGGLILVAICLGVGYLLGKKKKVIARAQEVIADAKATVREEVNKL